MDVATGEDYGPSFVNDWAKIVGLDYKEQKHVNNW